MFTGFIFGKHTYHSRPHQSICFISSRVGDFMCIWWRGAYTGQSESKVSPKSACSQTSPSDFLWRAKIQAYLIFRHTHIPMISLPFPGRRKVSAIEKSVRPWWCLRFHGRTIKKVGISRFNGECVLLSSITKEERSKTQNIVNILVVWWIVLGSQDHWSVVYICCADTHYTIS